MVPIKTASILPFFLFGLWLLQVVYFPQAEFDRSLAVSKAVEDKDIFRQILLEKELVPRGHYHATDEYLLQPEPHPPICLTCHGTHPHNKEKKVRSLFNFHAGFMACAVCHVRKDSEGKRFSFGWIDRESGVITTTVQGGYGKYAAKLFLTEITDQGEKRIFRPITEKAAQQFIKVKDEYTPDQVARAKVKLHEGISKKAVYCTECHKQEGYMNFAQLGFSQNRVNLLTSNEVANMIAKYDTFYLPSVIDLGFGDKVFE
jgi:hypothetical protein